MARKFFVFFIVMLSILVTMTMAPAQTWETGASDPFKPNQFVLQSPVSDWGNAWPEVVDAAGLQGASGPRRSTRWVQEKIDMVEQSIFEIRIDDPENPVQFDPSRRLLGERVEFVHGNFVRTPWQTRPLGELICLVWVVLDGELLPLQNKHIGLVWSDFSWGVWGEIFPPIYLTDNYYLEDGPYEGGQILPRFVKPDEIKKSFVRFYWTRGVWGRQPDVGITRLYKGDPPILGLWIGANYAIAAEFAGDRPPIDPPEVPPPDEGEPGENSEPVSPAGRLATTWGRIKS